MVVSPTFFSMSFFCCKAISFFFKFQLAVVLCLPPSLSIDLSIYPSLLSLFLSLYLSISPLFSSLSLSIYPSFLSFLPHLSIYPSLSLSLSRSLSVALSLSVSHSVHSFSVSPSLTTPSYQFFKLSRKTLLKIILIFFFLPFLSNFKNAFLLVLFFFF